VAMAIPRQMAERTVGGRRDRPLRGRVGVVTGAASGFGHALAEECARSGMSVALLDIDGDRAREAAASMAQTYGVETMAHRVDVGTARDVDEAAGAVRRRFGGCDLLFANVGVQQLGALERLTDDDWTWVLNVNVVGTARTVRSFLPLIRSRSGTRHIAMTASSSVLAPGLRLGAYQASKCAILGLGDTLRLELQGEGIGVTVIIPAGMATRHLESSALARPADLGDSGGLPDDIEIMIGSLSMTDKDLATPEHAARHVLRDIVANEPYVITHGGYRDAYRARCLDLDEAFDRMERS
jgi:NAD(P)-dependent dehydrogenase (short-subunit alcohol dehydrogenase family)